MADIMNMALLMEEFLDDAAGHLDAAETSIMELEKSHAAGTPDESYITLLLGNLHTLKGNSGMMGFTPLQKFIHRLESLVKLVADDAIPLRTSLFEGLYASVSVMREALRLLGEDPAARLDFDDQLKMLEVLANGAATEAAVAPTALAPEQCDEFTYISRKSNTLKVNFEKLDELLNLVGELVIHRTTLMALEGRFKECVRDRALLDAFGESSQLIGKSSTELREAIMRVRMLPVRNVFKRFQRLARDLSHRHGKQVQLVFEGEETELDKTVIDEIGEPLLHLIRNAVDHGIESPAERKRQGKPAAGTLMLQARHESNHIVIAVKDDGRGMDAVNIRESAIAKGLISSEEAQVMSEEESLQLLFLPGFSTSTEVTETSGRGIGLDVVKKIVSSLNGQIDISSKPGTGAVFTIKLPLTLAIITALMVEVEKETFAIPLSGVLESIRIQSSEIHVVGGTEVVTLRERLLPVHRLDHYFGLKTAASRQHEYIVVVGSGEKRGGLIVDRLVGQQEIVIKALDDYLGELPGISGGTVLGDGSISMIVDIGSILLGNRHINKERISANTDERSM